MNMEMFTIVIVAAIITLFMSIFIWIMAKKISNLISILTWGLIEYSIYPGDIILQEELEQYKKSYFFAIKNNLYKNCRLLLNDYQLNNYEDFVENLKLIKKDLNRLNGSKYVCIDNDSKTNKNIINMMTQILINYKGNKTLEKYNTDIKEKMEKYFESLGLSSYEDEIKKFESAATK